MLLFLLYLTKHILLVDSRGAAYKYINLLFEFKNQVKISVNAHNLKGKIRIKYSFGKDQCFGSPK